MGAFKKMSVSKYSVCDYNQFWNIRSREICDVVIMNPPFGTKGGNEHIDILFLLIAMKMARHCVYSLHKSSTTQFLKRFLEKFKLRNGEKREGNTMDIVVD